MAKKEKSYNPAQEQHKKDKKRAAEKIKQQKQNVNLAHASRRNPARLEAQIASLTQIDATGRLSDADRAVLNALEKEVRTIKKAKAKFEGTTGPIITSDRTKGDETERLRLQEKEEKRAFKEVLRNKRDPRRSVYYDEVWNPFGMPPPGMPYKERDEDDSEGWSTDEEVRKIPMPRDTPPAEKKPRTPRPQPARAVIERENVPPVRPDPVKVLEPVVPKEGPSETVEEAFLRAGAAVIEAAPVMRDFKKEAATIVPTIVKRRPPPKKAKKEEEPVKPPEKSFATTIEDVEEAEVDGEGEPRMPEEGAVASVARAEGIPVQNTHVEATLKRALEAEKKTEIEAPAAQPKRRRRLNAAPDV